MPDKPFFAKYLFTCQHTIIILINNAKDKTWKLASHALKVFDFKMCITFQNTIYTNFNKNNFRIIEINVFLPTQPNLIISSIL